MTISSTNTNTKTHTYTNTLSNKKWKYIEIKNKSFRGRISLNCESYHFEKNISLPADETEVLTSWMWILGFWKIDFQSSLNFHSRQSISKQTLSWQFSPHYTFFFIDQCAMDVHLVHVFTSLACSAENVKL